MSDEKKEMRKGYLYKGITAFLVVAASILFYFIIFKLDTIYDFIAKVFSVLAPVIFGFVIAYLVNPIVNFFNTKLHPFFKKRMKKPEKAKEISNAISVTLALLIFVIIIAGICLLVIPQFIESISDLIDELPSQIDSFTLKAEKFLKSNRKIESIVTKALDYEKNWLKTDLASTVNRLASSVASGVLGVVNFFKNLGIGLIVAIYILFSKRVFANQARKIICAVLPEKAAKHTFSWVSRTHTVFSGFINGKLVDSLIIGILCFIGCAILNIPYIVLVSVVIGVTNIIPVFGPWIGGIPCTALIAISDPLKALYFGIFVILLQLLDGNIIGPKILGSKTGLSAFWVVFAIVLGGGLFGFVGMLVGVPAFAVVYYFVSSIINHILGRKQKSTNSEDYSREKISELFSAKGGKENAKEKAD